MSLENFLLSRTIRTPGPLDTDCLVWTRKPSRKGYAVFRREGVPSQRVHRALWILKHGQIPEGLVLDHLCRNRACCNVEHMETVSVAERLKYASRTKFSGDAGLFCKHGHLLSVANLRMVRIGNCITRQCKECQTIRRKNYYWKKKALTGRGR